jgi:ribosome biogenesis GTPase A
VPLEAITDDVLEQFTNDPDGNLILGNLRAGSRTLNRVARVRQNYAGERMVVLGMPGKGKSQLIRSLLSQAMAEE